MNNINQGDSLEIGGEYISIMDEPLITTSTLSPTPIVALDIPDNQLLINFNLIGNDGKTIFTVINCYVEISDSEKIFCFLPYSDQLNSDSVLIYDKIQVINHHQVEITKWEELSDQYPNTSGKYIYHREGTYENKIGLNFYINYSKLYREGEGGHLANITVYLLDHPTTKSSRSGSDSMETTPTLTPDNNTTTSTTPDNSTTTTTSSTTTSTTSTSTTRKPIESITPNEDSINLPRGKNTIVRLLRSSTIYGSLKLAIQALNELVHIPGQPIISYYFLDENEIDCIFAIGVKNKSGKDAYSIISSESEILIDKILFGELPDITELSNGKIILCREKTSNKNYWVTLEQGERIITEIFNTKSLKVKEIETGETWWVNKDELKKISDYNTRAEFEAIKNQVTGISTTLTDSILPAQTYFNEELNKLFQVSLPLEITIESTANSNVYISGTTENIKLKLSASYRGEDVTSLCKWEISKSSWGNNEYKEITLNNLNTEKENYIVENCSKTETLKFRATYLGEAGNVSTRQTTEKDFPIIFTLNTLVGTIKLPNSPNLDIEYIPGKPLIDYYGLDSSDIAKEINNKNSDTLILNFITRSENEVLEVSNSYLIDEYLFVAIPVDHKPFSNIIDLTTNQSLLEEFETIGFEDGFYLKLRRDLSGNKADYNLYLKKSGIYTNDKKITILFKP